MFICILHMYIFVHVCVGRCLFWPEVMILSRKFRALLGPDSSWVFELGLKGLVDAAVRVFSKLTTSTGDPDRPLELQARSMDPGVR